ncbi:hypothetical protein PRIPAC_84478 [Pristionchus pacificus]|uniref:Protein kinase domain-containing protein n=1 Tax=Pristionchus pacificus TaxID=54126 RepID=A0A2A6BS72_PRIPA|nr:hypothetical protein PRIPAC_84478 [Pristionchus pacificus]|eukprot:PDM68802.1 protein kinase [Pristionchus pacificus]
MNLPYEEQAFEVNVEKNSIHKVEGDCPDCNKVKRASFWDNINPLKLLDLLKFESANSGDFVTKVRDVIMLVIGAIILYLIVANFIVPVCQCCICPLLVAKMTRPQEEPRYRTKRKNRVLDEEYFVVETVYKAKKRGCDVAVKTFRQGNLRYNEFFKEAEITRHLNHPNIVKTLGIYSLQPSIVTELLTGGDLKHYLRAHYCTSQASYLSIAQKISCAMSYLERKKIVHRDLGARNIMVGDSINTIKLSNFSLAERLGDSDHIMTSNTVFPYKWTAPEAFVTTGAYVNEEHQLGRISVASDVWSFAVLLWELYSAGDDPYDGIDCQQLYRKMKNEYRLECPSMCPEQIFEKMLKCWSLRYSDRPAFTQLEQFLHDPDLIYH